MAVTLACSAFAQDTARAVPHTPTLLSMPLVGVEDGKRFMDERQVPPSSIVEHSLPSSRPVNADPRFAGVRASTLNGPSMQSALGHPLPTSRISPLGTPRADFAVAPNNGQERRSGASPALTNTRLKHH